MGPFTLGELVLMEIALAEFAQKIDVSMYAGQSIQTTIGKAEIEIQKLTIQERERTHPPVDPNNPRPAPVAI